jgi:hypothetical protein
MGWSRHPESLTEKEASSSANADDPVVEAGVKENRGNLDTGYSAFAEYDGFFVERLSKKADFQSGSQDDEQPFPISCIDRQTPWLS